MGKLLWWIIVAVVVVLVLFFVFSGGDSDVEQDAGDEHEGGADGVTAQDSSLIDEALTEESDDIDLGDVV